uniref:Uncharacterized protein n=1 Tax=Ditylenchus dipsaci TaxID=166011 RepID=A0A915DNF4_9BILA
MAGGQQAREGNVIGQKEEKLRALRAQLQQKEDELSQCRNQYKNRTLPSKIVSKISLPINNGLTSVNSPLHRSQCL